MGETKLKRCPFCGGEAEVVGKGHYFAHKINGCILQHLCFEVDDKEAVARWNTRKPVDDVLERLEAIRQEYLKEYKIYLDGEDYRSSLLLDNAIEIIKEVLGYD